MSKHNRISHPIYNLLPTEMEGFDSLAELALDMRWSWNHATDEVWQQLDPELWEITHYPWVVLQTVSRNRIERVLADPVFRKNVDSLVQTRRKAVAAPAWFQKNHSQAPLTCVAYFRMEFMLSEALPIYSGGLGNVGGVLLTNGWDHYARKRAATNFNLDLTEMEDRHHLAFDTYEEGKITLEEYLGQVIFYEKRPFTRSQFRRFMFAQSKPYPEIIGLAAQLKVRHELKTVVVSNEGRELNAYRIRKFKLDTFVDSFVSSCFVHLRKPDPDIFRLALDIAQAPARQVLYIENTPMFVRIAEGLGIRSILHTDYRSTCAKLASFGLEVAE
jgi:putative hydrolase of the HAD superfamily